MSTNNGGPAFPCEEKVWLVDQSGMEPPTPVPTQCSGMSLRDYFAAKAMLMLGSLHANSNLRYSPEGGALKAYEIADAMLAARDAKP